MSTRIAAPSQPRIVPAFIVKELAGKIERELILFDKDGKKYKKRVEQPAGFMVTFPTKGHSIRVKNMDELKRLGFDQTIPLVDAESENDDVLGAIPNTINT